ncbi:TetR/AcrR family transcriptional regulator [Cronobacter muytjensii]|nr:TetR/AcrR family transcriptional regulator [Cronobacter muytjensii]
MNRTPEHDTREHLLATGEQLCLQRGFTGMGLSELLKTAGVPKGSFYHYFRSKEAFGVAMLERHYARYQACLEQHFSPAGPAREQLLTWFEETLSHYCQTGKMTGCLTVKLCAEVCDLSEDMRGALDKGAAQVMDLLAGALARGRDAKVFTFNGSAHQQAQVLYVLWLGASLQAKVSRSGAPLESALAHVKEML